MEIPDHWGTTFTKVKHQSLNATTDPAKVSLPPGYTVLITGAGRGIGQYIALAYASAGASAIVITSRTGADLDFVEEQLKDVASKAGRDIKVTTVVADSSEEQPFKGLKLLIDSEYGGRLDCLVNNAAVIGSNSGFGPHITETDADEMAFIFKVNYLGPYYAMKHLLPAVLKSESKTVINISSIASSMTDNNPIAYGASKLA